MPNYRTRVTDIIGGIKQRLGEYEYRGGATILRELVQNADDARATSLVFLLLDEGIRDAANSLLHGPALIAVNDGAFSPKDLDAISSQSASSKAEDEAAVGRFGIGQKSVFHLCEAFCFLGSSALGGVIGDVLDPWFDEAKGDQERPDWGGFEPADRDRVLAVVRPLLPSGDNWFVLWIPLRLDSHRRAQGLSLASQRCPELLDDVRAALQSEELPLLRPQLKHVHRITAYEMISGDAAPPTILAEARADAELGLCPREEFDRSGTTATMSAVDRDYVVVSHQQSSADDTLISLKQREGWPRAVYHDEQYNRQSRPEKALAHGAISIVRRRTVGGESSGVRMRWAVFLPVLDGSAQKENVGGAWQWWVTFHGYWFLDHGRRRIPWVAPPTELEARSDGEVLRREWNLELRDRVTLPLLLPAVADAVKELDAADATPFVNAIPELLRDQPRGAWADGKMLVLPAFEERWKLVDDSPPRRVLSVPRPPREVAPYVRGAFDALSGQVVVVFDDAPPLRSEPISAWREQDVDVVLAALAAGALDGEVVLYIAKWLRMCGPTVAPATNRFLWRAAANGQLPGDSSGALHAWKELVRLADSSRLVSVDITLRRMAEVARQVPSAEGQILPRHLVSVPASHHEPEVFVPLLRWLAQHDDYDSVLRGLTVALGVAALLSVAELEDVPILVLRRARDGKPVRKSPRDVRTAAAQRRLLLNRGIVRTERAVTALVQAVADPHFELYTVASQEKEENDRWAKVVPDISDAHPETLAEILVTAQLPLVGNAKERLPPLESLLPSNLESLRDPVRKALRYLLHGERKYIGYDKDLWILSPSLDSSTTRRLLDEAGLAWRVVSAVFVQELSPGARSALGIRELADDALSGLIGDIDVAALREIMREAPSEDRWRVLRTVDASSREQARRLPVHETLEGGELVAASDDHVYWQDSFAIHPSLVPHVKLVSLDRDVSVCEIQRRLLRRWTPETQREEALQRVSSGGPDMAAAILASLEAGATVDPILEARWLTLQSGAVVAPSQIALDSASVRDALAQLPDSNLHLETEVVASVRESLGWGRLRSHLERDLPQLFRRLCEHLKGAGCPQGWALASHPGRVAQLLDAGRTARARLNEHPEWRFALTAADQIGAELVASSMSGPVESRLWIDRLRLLATDATWKAFVAFIEVAAEEAEFVDEILPELDLRNANGDWVSASTIARDGEELEREFRIHPDIEHLLALFDEAEEHGEEAYGGNESRGDLEAVETFLQAGIDRGLSPQHAAALVSVFSPDGDVWDALLEKWNPPGSTSDELRKKVFATAFVDQSRKRKLGDPLPMDVFATHGVRTAVVFVEPGSAQKRISLTGAVIDVRVRVTGASDSLVVGGPGTAIRSKHRTVKLLRVTPPSAMEFASMLREGVRTILEDHFLLTVSHGDLETLWSALSGDSARMQLATATRMVERDLPVTLQQLSVARIPDLVDLLHRLRDIDLRVSRLKEEDQPGSRGEVGELETEAERCRQELVALVRGRHAHAVAERVRAKLTQYQYSPRQVLWELLQNADDAVVQLHGPLDRSAGARAEDARLVDIGLAREGDATTLSLRHRGRAINSRRPGAGHASDEADLYNMLVLNISEKEAEQGVTGKFGLGFKSVHLLSSRPLVTSGALRFEIQAGVLPKALFVDDASSRETTFTLPLDVSFGESILDETQELLPWFLLFSAGVQAVSVRDGVRCEWRETEQAVLGDTIARVMARQEGDEVMVLEQTRNDRRHVVLLMSARRAALPDPVPPSVWVTAPVLTETWRLPYLLGGPFDLDVGRTQLASDSDKNAATFQVLGEMLRDLVAGELEGIAPASGERGASRMARLDWLWRVFLSDEVVEKMRAGGFRAQLMRELHTSGRGASFLARRALPTGLPAPWSEVTTAERVRWYVPDDGQKAAVSLLQAMRPHVPDLPRPGEVVGEAVHDRLKLLGEGAERRRLDVRELLRRSDAVLEHIDVEHAKLVGFVAGLQLTRTEDEFERQSWLRRRRFRSRSGDWRSADQLLVTDLPSELPKSARRDDLEDEPRRALFAPAEYLLPEDFCGEGEFEAFLACRARLAVGTARELADWARRLNAGDQERCRGVMRYLVDGTLRAELARELRRERPPWVPAKADLVLSPSHWLVAGLPDAEIAAIVNALYPPTHQELLGYRSIWMPVPVPVRDPAEELPRALLAWQRKRESLLRRHDEDTFGREIRLSFTDPDAESWLALFTRAALYRTGRVTAEQNSGFMRLCWDRGWFALFAGPEHDMAFGRVIGDLQRRAVSDVPYLNWLMALVFTHWFATHLRDYLELLEKLDCEDRNANVLRLSLDPRSSAVQSGGGYDLPPMTVLRWGLPFVLRELRRRGVLSSSSWDPLCFATNGALRRALQNVGLLVEGLDDSHHALVSSQRVYEALEGHLGADAAFKGGFDLALIHYSPETESARTLTVEELLDDDL